MKWSKDCGCNRKITDFESIEFKINGSKNKSTVYRMQRFDWLVAYT